MSNRIIKFREENIDAISDLYKSIRDEYAWSALFKMPSFDAFITKFTELVVVSPKRRIAPLAQRDWLDTEAESCLSGHDHEKKML